MNPRPLALASLALLAAAVPARASSTTVEAVDSAFRPATKTVAVGDKVTWHNSGSMPHDVTASAFKSGNLAAGASYSWTATAAGTYAYVCRYHESAGMKGTLVVRAASASGLPKTGGDRTALGLLVLGIACAAGVSLRYGWSAR